MKTDNINIHGEYTASSKTDLLNYLKKQDITVLARTKGRLSQHCERWGVFRLLATWATGNCFSYPLRLVHQDKPDFLLCYGGHEVGIEFTEATSQELAETDALAEKMGKETLLFMDQFKRDTPKRTAEERRKLIKEQPHGTGFVNNEADREWALSIRDRVLAKTENFNKPDFRKYDTNWLLIYDNLYLPNFKIEKSMKFLMAYISDYWLQKNRYSGLLIDTGDQVIKGNWDRQQIVDLWTQPNAASE